LIREICVSRSTKLFWGEGLFLRPQHFQRQDAYHEACLSEVSTSLHPYGWGVRQNRFDALSASSGTLRPLQLSVIFPDGTLYSAPDTDDLPQALSLESVTGDAAGTIIHLAIPQMKEFGSNSSDEEDPTARFSPFKKQTSDLFTDADEAELVYLKKSARLLTDDQPRDAFVTVPVARVRRTPTGNFELDDMFIPPTVNVQASPALFLQLRRLLDVLQAKVHALFGTHREPSQNVIEFRSGDIASFWLLHTSSSAFASLSHLLNHPGLHPERLYQELLRLAGALMTFSKSYTLSDLPAYSHKNPEPAFSSMFEIIRELVDTVISARYFAIALTKTKPSFYLGRIDSQRIDDNSVFYLAVAADMPPQELVSAVPVRFKVGAPDDVDKMVLSALPGVKLTHAAQVPGSIPVRPNHYYFAVETRGPLYERMLKSQSIVIYAPNGINDLKLELIALTP
jgi:type VI secretion system protein ImpJ